MGSYHKLHSCFRRQTYGVGGRYQTMWRKQSRPALDFFRCSALRLSSLELSHCFHCAFRFLSYEYHKRRWSLAEPIVARDAYRDSRLLKCSFRWLFRSDCTVAVLRPWVADILKNIFGHEVARKFPQLRLTAGFAGRWFAKVFIGFQLMGLVVKSDDTLVTLGDFGPGIIIGLFGLFLVIVLILYDFKGAILFGPRDNPAEAIIDL